MENDTPKKMRFEKALEKAFKEGRYDYFGISSNKTLATLNASELSGIKNAIVFVSNAGSIQKWIVEDYQVQQCPDELHICIKNSKVMLGCVGDHNVEASFFEYREKKESNSVNERITIGVVEIYEGACAFYFDEMQKKKLVLYNFQNQEDSPLYNVISGMVKIQEEMNTSADEKEQGYMWDQGSSTTELWSDQ